MPDRCTNPSCLEHWPALAESIAEKSRQIVAWHAEGLNDQQIAERFSMSKEPVKWKPAHE